MIDLLCKRLPLTLGLNCRADNSAYTLSPQEGGEREKKRASVPSPRCLHFNGERAEIITALPC
jgi:hypothetical protein